MAGHLSKTVDELLTGVKGPITNKELNEWKAFSVLEPFGPREEMKRALTVACAIFNAAPRGKGDQKVFKPEDYLIDYDKLLNEIFETEEDKKQKMVNAIKQIAIDINNQQAQKSKKIKKREKRRK